MMTNKKTILSLAVVALLVVAFSVPAGATKLSFHGDMNHRFLLGTDHNEFIRTLDSYNNVIDDGDNYDNFAEIKAQPSSASTET